MKKNYINAEIEFTKFEVADIITLSELQDNSGDEDGASYNDYFAE